MSEPTVLCEECLISVIVDYTMGEFPPDVAKKKLEKLCKAQGHTSKPKYRAGLERRGRFEGQHE